MITKNKRITIWNSHLLQQDRKLQTLTLEVRSREGSMNRQGKLLFLIVLSSLRGVKM